MVYMHKHFSQKHSNLLDQQVALADVVCCSMHGEHNLFARPFYATITHHLWKNRVTQEVAKVINEELSMERFTIKQQAGQMQLPRTAHILRTRWEESHQGEGCAPPDY
jgi:hypothetical protein